MSEAVVYDAEEKPLTEEEQRFMLLDELGEMLSTHRSECIEHRENCGIELEWLEDEEHYEGIDDKNRGEQRAWRGKPLGQASISDPDKSVGSNIFLNITRPYVDAAAARVGDMAQPTDDKAWAIDPTPLPELIQIAENGKLPSRVEQQIEESEQLPTKELKEKTKADLRASIKKEIDEAREAASKAERQIEDWHVECQFHAQMRMVIEDAAKLGTGVLKGPVPMRQKRVAWKDGELKIQDEQIPTSYRIDPWNLYPDAGCGENIHDGNGIWERDDITPKKLRQLIGVDGYEEAQILEVLKEGPHRATKTASRNEERTSMTGLEARRTTNLFEIWYYHGMIDAEIMNALGVECDEAESAHGYVVMVNNRVIRAVLNTLDTGEFPYDVLRWQRRVGLPWGMGVARQIRAAQRIVNGGVRAMMDNAGMAAAGMIVFKPGVASPVDGIYEFRPRKFWMADGDADLDHLDNAFRVIEMAMHTSELQSIINFGLKVAEDVTGLPLIMQGQQGKAPDTVGGMQILTNNASTVMRRIARLLDDSITEPHVRRYYNYLLQYGEDDSMKGDFSINAQGSSALVQRDIQNESIGMILQSGMAKDPSYGWDPEKVAEEWAKSQHLDPKRLQYDDEEKRKRMQQMLAGPKDSSVEIAQMRSEVEMSKLQVRTQELEQKDRHKQMDIAIEQAEQEFRVYLEQLKLDTNVQINEEKIKAGLTDTFAKLRAQIALQSEGPAPQLLEPVAEPAERASAGEAFIR